MLGIGSARVPDICLVRQNTVAITDADRDAVRRVVFGVIDGLGDVEQRRWRRFWTWLLRLEPGELVRISTLMERSSPYHRRHFSMEQRLFDAQERFIDFSAFRYWGKVGAGWVTWAAGPKGGVVPIPKSVSYKKADQMEFEEFHRLWVQFMRGEHAAKYLWPHLKGRASDDMMDSILMEFEE